MRKIIGWVLLGLGAFLLVTGLLATVWVPQQVERTPLDVDSTTHLSGTADKLNPASGETEAIDVKATSVTKTDSKRSDDDVVVFVNTTCLVIDEGDVPDCVDADDPRERLVSATSDVFSTDRYDALAVNGKYLPAGAEEKEGLVNKWPFNTEKKDYQYWDGSVGAPVTAAYDSTEDLDGLETYKFHILLDETPAEIIEGVRGTYSRDKYIWVEPRTGCHRQPGAARDADPRGRHTGARPEPCVHRGPGRERRPGRQGQQVADRLGHRHVAAGRLHRRHPRAARGRLSGVRRS
ncbi:DUF3068 domain-containing protein [Nocardioides sp. B-3]|nr:DUF3068 domain-containing protein [Nocardioides sp. B-3]UUZ58854.1 DUF3068 domain-containing protein [Nocardioides sp. B-3]